MLKSLWRLWLRLDQMILNRSPWNEQSPNRMVKKILLRDGEISPMLLVRFVVRKAQGHQAYFQILNIITWKTSREKKPYTYLGAQEEADGHDGRRENDIWQQKAQVEPRRSGNWGRLPEQQKQLLRVPPEERYGDAKKPENDDAPLQPDALAHTERF